MSDPEDQLTPAPVKGLVHKSEDEWGWSTYDNQGEEIEWVGGFDNHKAARDDICTKYADVAIPVEVDLPPEPVTVEAPVAEASGAPE